MSRVKKRMSSREKHRKKAGKAPVLCPLAPSLSLGVEYEFVEVLRDMEIRHRRARRPPCRVETRLGSPLDAKEINAPNFRRIELCCQTLHGQRHLRHPSLALLVDYDAAPQSTL